MLKPQDLFDELPRNARPEQHTNHHRVQQVLDLRHAFVPIAQGAVYAVIALRTDGFMHSELSLNRFHLQLWELLAQQEPLEVLRLLA